MTATITDRAFGMLEYVQEIHIEAPVARVFEAVTQEVGDWFPARFIEGSTVVCEPGAGGRIYEDGGDGRQILWDWCTAWFPNAYVAYQSTWGFAGGAAVILVEYWFEEADGGTTVRVKNRIVGDIPEGSREGYVAHMAPVSKWLKDYVEGP